MNKIFTGLSTIFKQSFYRNIAVVASLIFAYISYWLFYQTTTIPTFFENIKNAEFGQYSLLYGMVYIVTTLLIILLSGVSVAVMVWLFKHSKLNRGKALTTNIGGFIAGMLGMGCPVCGAFLLSALGVAGGLSVFPLQGLELKFLSLGLLTASTIYGARKVNSALNCKDCNNISGHIIQSDIPTKETTRKVFVGSRIVILPLHKLLVFLLAGLFLINQLIIGQVTANMGMSSKSNNFIGQLLGIKTASSYTIIAPKVNPDGKTTSLVEWPTITEVMANPNTKDALADAKVVMIATGKPFYAPEDISFDDPINAQKKWGAFETSIKLSTEQEARYQKLITTMMTCSYCCGGPTSVTMNKNCGCAHAKAVRGFYKFMIQNYGDKYSDEQLVGESHRWYAIWYPKGMLEDYLLATGKSDALPHETHGGAGTDGKHGL